MKAIQLQYLRHDFKTLLIRGSESVDAFMTRVSEIVSQMNSCGENPTDQTIVSKVLQSLNSRLIEKFIANS